MAFLIILFYSILTSVGSLNPQRSTLSFLKPMWPAIILLWLSLLWTLLCLLFYRDRAIILEVSLPAWIIALLVWVILWSPVSVFKIGRLWGRKGSKGRKKKASSPARATKTGRAQSRVPAHVRGDAPRQKK